MRAVLRGKTSRQSPRNPRRAAISSRPGKWFLDKGYHSNDTTRDLQEAGLRTYISEPERGRRKWEGKAEERDAVYANRRRIRGAYGKKLLRNRGELIERSFAHCYETGAMRPTHLRHHDTILKRLLIHVGAFNLSLIFRRAIGFGTPRGLRQQPTQGMKRAPVALVERLCAIGCAVWAHVRLWKATGARIMPATFAWRRLRDRATKVASATGC
jgi:hypothetical protein